MFVLEYFTDDIIQSSFDNSAGTLMNKVAINLVVNLLIESKDLSKYNVDKLISENESEYGYMIKYSDFNYALRDNLIGDNLQQDFESEKPEKDLKMVELMYGGWHAECGDRD